jgi:hypothetical protein
MPIPDDQDPAVAFRRRDADRRASMRSQVAKNRAEQAAQNNAWLKMRQLRKDFDKINCMMKMTSAREQLKLQRVRLQAFEFDQALADTEFGRRAGLQSASSTSAAAAAGTSSSSGIDIPATCPPQLLLTAPVPHNVAASLATPSLLTPSFTTAATALRLPPLPASASLLTPESANALLLRSLLPHPDQQSWAAANQLRAAAESEARKLFSHGQFEFTRRGARGDPSFLQRHGMVPGSMSMAMDSEDEEQRVIDSMIDTLLSPLLQASSLSSHALRRPSTRGMLGPPRTIQVQLPSSGARPAKMVSTNPIGLTGDEISVRERYDSQSDVCRHWPALFVHQISDFIVIFLI